MLQVREAWDHGSLRAGTKKALSFFFLRNRANMAMAIATVHRFFQVVQVQDKSGVDLTSTRTS